MLGTKITPEMDTVCKGLDRLLIELDKQERSHRGSLLQTGRRLDALIVAFEHANGTKNGFYQWAAVRFNQPAPTLRRYVGYARHPETLNAKNAAAVISKRDPRYRLRWLKSSFPKMADEEQQEFLAWLCTYIENKDRAAAAASGRGGRFVREESGASA